MKQHFSTGRWVWQVTAYPAAKEGVITLIDTKRERALPSGRPPDLERSEREARRRAATKVRRLCAANGLNRLWTLTYAEESTGWQQTVCDMARFNRKMKVRFPKWRYLYVLESGERNGRLHVHFATNVYIPKSTVATAWNHGFVDGRRITTGGAGDARSAARYLAKYVSKPADEERRERHRRRFVPAHGLRLDTATARHLDYVDAENALSALIGAGAPDHVWRSSESPDWKGPPCTVAWWPLT